MATDVMIEAESLSKRFGNVRALDGISFQVKKGEVVGFLGPNGAGKSTTMRILTCFLAPTGGTARVNGIDVFEDPLAVRGAIGYLPQRAPLYTDMGVLEYLKFVAEIRGLDAPVFRKNLGKVIDVCGLAQVLNANIGTLSHGYRQRVGLGQALLHDPQILILDEPTADLDPNEKAEVIRHIQQIGEDRTVLLSTHNLSEVEQACARAIIVSKGKVVADGQLEEIRSRTGSVRYVVGVDEKASEPSFKELEASLGGLKGVKRVSALPQEDSAQLVELAGDQDSDLRADIFRLAVDKGWTLLELHRESQSLDAVFRDLTQGDEALDRGRKTEASAPSKKQSSAEPEKSSDSSNEEQS
ncbi:MAG: ATP-binding cassette domain-containing protein [Polyangiaceae bacterium]|nr:ATP-binding cassette domain-containing protein [Polyangiaceae bacterium]